MPVNSCYTQVLPTSQMNGWEFNPLFLRKNSASNSLDVKDLKKNQTNEKPNPNQNKTTTKTTNEPTKTKQTNRQIFQELYVLQHTIVKCPQARGTALRS